MAPVYDRSIEEAIAGAVVVRGDVPLVVTEGNYLLLDRPPWRDARALLDEVWHLEPPRGLRLERLVARHVAHGKESDAAREWALGSDERNARLVAAVANRADAVWRLVDPVGDDSVGDDLVDDGPTGDRSTGDGPVGDRVSPAR